MVLLNPGHWEHLESSALKVYLVKGHVNTYLCRHNAA